MRTLTLFVVNAALVSVLVASTAQRSGATSEPRPAGNADTIPTSSNSVDPAVQKPAQPAQSPKQKQLSPFASEQELRVFLQAVAEQQREWRRRNPPRPMSAAAAPSASPSPAGVAGATASSFDSAASITNVQHAGVDEGGIVKVHGNHLVVLRRGRLFTVAIGGSALQPVSAIDAFAPDINPMATYYDEMLVAGDTVVVIGYSYQRGGTEIGLFDIDRDGQLRYRSTYHLRSNDYYSSRNYSSRLIGTTLVFYTPLYMWIDGDPLQSLPALRKWRSGATLKDFQRIASATRVYRPARPLNETGQIALHTITSCDLTRQELECEATVVAGSPGRVFYVSPQSVYVWTSERMRLGNDPRQESLVYRMPLDGSAPSAIGAAGSPVDQFSLLESADGHLNVLVRSEAAGDGMWAPEVADGDVALLRLPLDAFADGSTAAPWSSYRALPTPKGYAFHNRFVGNHLLYGIGSGWGRPEDDRSSRLYAVRFAGGEVFELPLPHGVDRIEVLGPDAVVVGANRDDLHFTPVRLGAKVETVPGYVRKGASQGELRSHGFFYKPDTAGSGLLGLPISRPSRPGYQHLFQNSAGILFLRNDALRFTEVGELDAQAARAVDDKCRASCVDWYGNARPLFIGSRVFALLGYEVVEGTLADGRLREMRRVSYAPSLQ
jgi:hypothetical protein